MLNSVGLQDPGVARLAADELPRAASTPGPRWWPASGAARSTSTAAAAALLADAGPEVVAVEVNLSAAPTSTAGATCSPSRPTRPRPRSSARRAACGRPLWAKLSPNVDRPSTAIAGAALDAGAEARDAGQHRAGHGHRPRRPAGRGSAPGAAGCRARPSTRSRCGPSTSARAACPDLPHRRRRRRDPRGRRRRAADGRAPTRSRSGTATFADPRAPAHGPRRSATLVCATTAITRVADLIGAAHA